MAGVVVQAIESAGSIEADEWIATAAGVLVGAVIAYLSALPSQVEFDAARREVSWCHTGWPGRERGSCPLDQVTGIELLEDPSGTERLALATPAGCVPLTRFFTAFQRHEENVAAINQWLEVHGALRGESLNGPPHSGAV